MTEDSIQSEETGPATDSPTGGEPERNYANDYAAYWQARSGYFDRIPNADRSQSQTPADSPVAPDEARS